MNRQQEIDSFLASAHRLALSRLREQPHRLQEAAAMLSRWRNQAGPTRSDPYWNEWETLLENGVDAIEQSVCVDSDHAAALRSVSPLSVLITQAERSQLLRQAREAV
jgi:hypothetical protein